MEDLDTLVRRVDEDRWLASRFAPAEVRARLIAIYAVNYEIARTAETVREAALGDIRLEWWRSGLEEIAQGGTPRAHPALNALRATLRESVDAALMQQVVTARAADFEQQPFATWHDLEAYVDATAGTVLRVCALQCGAPDAVPDGFVTAAGRAWGYTGLLRATVFAQSHGRSLLPRSGGEVGELAVRARANYGAARKLASALPQEVFPAIGYVTLVPGYLRAMDDAKPTRPLILRQLSLVAAAATGKV